MNQNERNSRKRLNSLILLVAFTAVMLIVSTYAWFSTQKNVTIGGLRGEVKVAEGLQISLDAKTWSNSIDLGAFKKTKDQDTKVTTWTSDQYLPGATFQAPYIIKTTGEGEELVNTYATNVTPDDLLPVSTTAGTGDGLGEEKIDMYWGDISEGKTLKGVKEMVEETKSGYFAFDIFLQNSSSTNAPDKLQLEPYSTINVDTGKESTGLQNTVRVAFALYDNTNDNKVTVNSTPSTADIISGTTYKTDGNKQTIKDVAIWEPNSDYHTIDIVNSNNNIKWSQDDLIAYGFEATGYDDGAKVAKFDSVPGEGKVSKIPTYVLSSESIVPIADRNKVEPGEDDWVPTYDTTMDNIWDWATPEQGLKKQITLQTTAVFDENNNFKTGAEGDGMKETAKLDLISIKNSELYADDADENDPELYDHDNNEETDPIKDTRFMLTGGQYHKIRVYLWIEGQDVDATNLASLGSGVTLDIGFSKPGTQAVAE